MKKFITVYTGIFFTIYDYDEVFIQIKYESLPKYFNMFISFIMEQKNVLICCKILSFNIIFEVFFAATSSSEWFEKRFS